MSLLDLDDDCDLEANFAAAANLVASDVVAGQNRVGLVQTCRDQVRQTYCDVIAAIEAATITGPGPSSGSVAIAPLVFCL